MHLLPYSFTNLTSSDIGPVLEGILQSFQQYPNPELDDEEKLIALRKDAIPDFQRQVAALFERCHPLKPLQDKLQQLATASGIEMITSAPALVCNIGIGDTQQTVLERVLAPAINSTLEAAKQGGKITTVLLDGLLEIVGWWAVTLVNDIWIQAHRVALRDMSSPGVLNIGLGRSHLIELVVARANTRSAKIVRAGKSSIASGSGVVLEGPDSAQDTLAFVFRKLAERFMPDEEFVGLREIPKEDWEELDARIRMRRVTENIFIAFRMSEGWGDKLRAQLSRHLQCLPQIWIKSQDEAREILLLSERRVWGILGELVATIESYRDHVAKDRSN